MDFIQLLESESSSKSTPKPKPNSLAYVFGGTIGFLTVTITAASVPFILPYFRKVCLPYLPATTASIENILKALEGRSGKLIDLGSGDGRIVFATANKGFHSTGIDLNYWLIIYSKIAATWRGLYGKVIFKPADLWKFNLKPYNNVVIFGVETMMEKLEKKFSEELEEGTHVVACRFPLPNLQPTKIIGNGWDKVWLYEWKKLNP